VPRESSAGKEPSTCAEDGLLTTSRVDLGSRCSDAPFTVLSISLFCNPFSAELRLPAG
jgi:hypothetical protein